MSHPQKEEDVNYAHGITTGKLRQSAAHAKKIHVEITSKKYQFAQHVPTAVIAVTVVIEGM